MLRLHRFDNDVIKIDLCTIPYALCEWKSKETRRERSQQKFIVQSYHGANACAFFFHYFHDLQKDQFTMKFERNVILNIWCSTSVIHYCWGSKQRPDVQIIFFSFAEALKIDAIVEPSDPKVS